MNVPVTIVVDPLTGVAVEVCREVVESKPKRDNQKELKIRVQKHSVKTKIFHHPDCLNLWIIKYEFHSFKLR